MAVPAHRNVMIGTKAPPSKRVMERLTKFREVAGAILTDIETFKLKKYEILLEHIKNGWLRKIHSISSRRYAKYVLKVMVDSEILVFDNITDELIVTPFGKVTIMKLYEGLQQELGNNGEPVRRTEE